MFVILALVVCLVVLMISTILFPSDYVLDSISARSGVATFFCIGSQVEARPEVYRSILAQGHEVANHDIVDRRTFVHPPHLVHQGIHQTHSILQLHHKQQQQLQATSNDENTNKNIDGGEELVVKFFRPGGGLFNSVVLRTASTLGYKVVLGDAYPFDPSIRIVQWMKWHLRRQAREGSIIVLHDGSGERVMRTAETLRDCLTHLRSCGIEVVTLSELLEG